MRRREFVNDEVADAAMHLFWKRGYAATSIDDLVAGTGLSRSSLYNAFSSKHGLYQEALRRYEAVTSDNVALIEGEGAPRHRIRKFLMRIVADEVYDEQRRGCFVANASLELAGHDDQVAKLVAHNFQRLEAALANVIRQGQRLGEVDTRQSPQALARFIVNTVQGLRVLGKGAPTKHRRKMLSQVVAVALQALEPRPSPRRARGRW